MMSPTLTGDNTATPGRWAQTRRGPQDQRVPNLSQSVFREAPGRMASSMMMRSSLLDHHHQPSAGATTANTFGAKSTRFQPSTGASLKEEDDEEDSSRNIGSHGFRSQLGESFVSTGVDAEEEELDDDEDKSSGANAGVLGLLNQFVAAHGEGGGRTGGAAVM